MPETQNKKFEIPERFLKPWGEKELQEIRENDESIKKEINLLKDEYKEKLKWYFDLRDKKGLSLFHSQDYVFKKNNSIYEKYIVFINLVIQIRCVNWIIYDGTNGGTTEHRYPRLKDGVLLGFAITANKFAVLNPVLPDALHNSLSPLHQLQWN